MSISEKENIQCTYHQHEPTRRILCLLHLRSSAKRELVTHLPLLIWHADLSEVAKLTVILVKLTLEYANFYLDKFAIQ